MPCGAPAGRSDGNEARAWVCDQVFTCGEVAFVFPGPEMERERAKGDVGAVFLRRHSGFHPQEILFVAPLR